MKYLRLLSNSQSCNVGVNNTNIVPTPYGFVTRPEAYWDFLKYKGLKVKLEKLFKEVDIDNVGQVGQKVRELIFKNSLPVSIKKELDNTYNELCNFYNPEDIDIAMLNVEVEQHMNDAGLQMLEINHDNKSGAELLYFKVLESYASLFTDRAIYYRQHRSYDHFQFSTKYSLKLSSITISVQDSKRLVA